MGEDGWLDEEGGIGSFLPKLSASGLMGVAGAWTSAAGAGASGRCMGEQRWQGPKVLG